MHNLLALLQLHARHTRDNEPFVNYSYFNVVALKEYLVILSKKTLDKGMMGKAKKEKQKEREEEQARIVTNLLITIKQAKCKVVNKWVRAQFFASWSTTTIREVGDCFHQYYQLGFKAHPLG